jgi:CBS domain containing-hemolysin-like protein
MNLKQHPEKSRRVLNLYIATLLVALVLTPGIAGASLFQGETLDAVANGAAWVVLFLAPAIAIGVFWIVHILPEKIAENRHHPQAKAIQTLCLLSLFFGGMLWPLAWLWAYSKPVFYKMAYGTDRAESEHAREDAVPDVPDDAAEIRMLRQRLNELEARMGSKRGTGEA